MERLTDRVMVEQLRWNTIFMGKVTDIAFTSDFGNNYSHSASLYLTSPHPRPTCPHIPYFMSSSPLSRVPNSQVPTNASHCPCPVFPVPLLYTRKEKKEGRRESEKKKSRLLYVHGMSGTFNPKTILKVCFLHMPKHQKLIIFCIGIRRP